MLNKKFKHKYWFVGNSITKKEFLDYVLSKNGDFTIKTYRKVNKNDWFNEIVTHYLTDGVYTYKLNEEEIKYLSDNNEYFKKRLIG